MSDVITVHGVDCYEKGGVAYLNLEAVARGLGFTQTAKSGNEVVRWERVNGYLKELGFIPTSGYDGYIPENIFYRLAMKAKNEAAERFQALIADEVIPAIRKTGSYSALPARPLSGTQLLRLQVEAMEQLEREQAALSRAQAQQNEMLIDQHQRLSNQEHLLDGLQTALRTYAPRTQYADGADWRRAMHNRIMALCTLAALRPKTLYNAIYAMLQEDAHVDLKARVKNRKARMQKAGAPAAEVNAVSALRIVSEDAKLRIIFERLLQGYEVEGALHRKELPNHSSGQSKN